MVRILAFQAGGPGSNPGRRTIFIMKEVTIKTRTQWRKWLEKNHEKEKKVHMIIHKKHTGVPSISHREQIEEAICFGWIDTTVKRLDEDTFQRIFVKRTDKSKWSNNTLSYAENLIKRGLMTPAGLKRYKEGKSRPTHDHDIPKNPDPPEELMYALKKSKTLASFEKLTPSVKKMTLRWLLSAKLPETKKKRIQKIIESCKEGKKIF